jgi:hypothetical protein
MGLTCLKKLRALLLWLNRMNQKIIGFTAENLNIEPA